MDFKPYIEVACISSIIISIVISLASFKWYNATNLIIYEQVIYQLLLSFIPSDTQNFFDMSVFQVCFLLFVFYFTEQGV